jgi:ubiquinone/menaquinone biosynthesis C-methylase UbiE
MNLSPKVIWKLRGVTFHNEEYQKRIFSQHEWLVEKVNKLNVQNVLEVGCGFGRNLELLSMAIDHPIEISGADISKQMLRQAGKIPNIDKNNLHQASAGRQPFDDMTFDLVFTHGLLMHIEPKNLAETLREICRVSRKYVIIIEQINAGDANSYTFSHSYLEELPSHGLEITETVYFEANELLIACICKKVSQV